MEFSFRSSKLWTFLETWCINPRIQANPIEFRQARMVLFTCLAAGPTGAVLIFAGYLADPEHLIGHAATLIGHLLVCSTALLLRPSKSMAPAVNFFVVVSTLQILSATLWSGGVHSPVLYSLPLVSIFFALIGKLWHSLLASAILITGVGVIFTLDANGVSYGPASAGQAITAGALIWVLLLGTAIAFYHHKVSSQLLAMATREVENHRIAQETAEDTARAKGLFMAFLSHEIRNPLAVILGSADLMRLPEQEAHRDRHLHTLTAASHGLASLLDDVMDLSSLEQGLLKVKQDPVDLSQVLGQVVDLYTVEAETKNLSLSLKETTTSWVTGDSNRIRQVITNLVGNAIKFTDSGTVAVETSRVGDRVQVSIRDTGPGIEGVHRDLAFKSFERGLQGALPGKGLGLAVCSGLLERMGSRLQLESPAEGGCRFYFRLDMASERPGISSDPLNATAGR